MSSAGSDNLTVQGPNSGQTGQCLEFTATLVNAAGNPVVLSQASTVSISSGNASAAVYGTSSCSTPSSKFSIGAGESSIQFYIEGAQAGTFSFKAMVSSHSLGSKISDSFSVTFIGSPNPPPSPSPTPTPTPTPTPSPTTSPNPNGPDANQQQLLNLINQSRASAGLPPYTFSAVQSAGTSTCVGSYGHSVHMEQAGTISHDQFPADVCIPYSMAGENVGEGSGSESSVIQELHQLMMNEGPSGGHYQNIMNPNFTTVGIGLYYVNGVLWLTEDFTN